MNENVMTLEHAKWEDFYNLLGAMTSVLGCKHQTDNATYILTMMELDVDESLKYLRKRGGYCDCEILMNVPPLPDNLEELINASKK